MTTKEIIDEATSLPVEQRAYVATSILRTLNRPDSELDALWATEAKRRLAEIESGQVAAVPGNEVFTQIRKRLGR